PIAPRPTAATGSPSLCRKPRGLATKNRRRQPTPSGSAGATRRLKRRRNQPANRSLLIAVSLEYGRSDEFFSPFSARVHAMGGAPIRKCVRIDADPHDNMAVGFETTLHFLGDLQPFLPGARHPVAVGECSQQRRIILLVDPIGSDCGRRSVFWVGHTDHLIGVVVANTPTVPAVRSGQAFN